MGGDIFLTKADPIVNPDEVKDTIIHINQYLPKFEGRGRDCLKAAEKFYDDEATKLEEALQNSLPQGVKDRLLIKLMKRKVSLYRGITS